MNGHKLFSFPNEIFHLISPKVLYQAVGSHSSACCWKANLSSRECTALLSHCTNIQPPLPGWKFPPPRGESQKSQGKFRVRRKETRVHFPSAQLVMQPLASQGISKPQSPYLCTKNKKHRGQRRIKWGNMCEMFLKNTCNVHKSLKYYLVIPSGKLYWKSGAFRFNSPLKTHLTMAQ